MPEVIYKVDLPAFTGRNVPIKEIAAAIGKDAQYVSLILHWEIPLLPHNLEMKNLLMQLCLIHLIL